MITVMWFILGCTVSFTIFIVGMCSAMYIMKKTEEK